MGGTPCLSPSIAGDETLNETCICRFTQQGLGGGQGVDCNAQPCFKIQEFYRG